MTVVKLSESCQCVLKACRDIVIVSMTLMCVLVAQGDRVVLGDHYFRREIVINKCYINSSLLNSTVAVLYNSLFELI